MQELRGLASLAVVLGAHLFGVFWFDPHVVGSMIGVPDWTGVPVPSAIRAIQQFPQIGFGHLGVATFFLISGFVVPYSLKRLPRGPFIVARAARIFPVYWAGLAIGLIALAICVVVLQGEWTLGTRHVVLQALLVRDLFALPSIDQISWTLESQLKFYLLCAAIRGPIVRYDAETLVAIGFAGLLALLAVVAWLPEIRRLSHSLGELCQTLSSEWTYISYMLIGVVFHFHHAGKLDGRRLALFVVALFSAFCLGWRVARPGTDLWGAVNYGAALLVFVAFYFARAAHRRTVLGRLGDISYPLFVVHPLVGYVTLALALNAGYPATGAIALSVVNTLLLACLLHLLIEKRIDARRV